MASIAGRKCKVYWSTDGGTTFVQMLGIDTIAADTQAAPINDDEFGDEWEQFISGILSNPIKISGGFRPADTTGQMAVRAALVSGAFQDFRVFYDGTTTGFKQQVVVTKFSTNTVTKDRTTVAIELQSNGAPTFLP
jgi:predicted secreted protein